MRWSSQGARTVAILSAAIIANPLAGVVAAPMPQENASGGTGHIAPVRGEAGDSQMTVTPNIPHPGAPTAVAERQETLNGLGVADGGASETYNNGMYTPWTPPAETTQAAPATDNSVYLQPTPTEAASVAVTSAATATEATPSPESTIATTPPAVSSETPSTSTPETSETSSSAETSSVPTTASTSPTSSALSRTSPSSTSSSLSISGILDASNKGTSAISGNGQKMNVILPVALSLGALALLAAGIAFVVWRRRISRQRSLAARRYDHAFGEKGSGYDSPDDGDDEKFITEAAPAIWQQFNRYSAGPYDGIDSGMAGAGIKNLQTPPMTDPNHDPNAFRPRDSRRPLPMTPQQPNEEYAPMVAGEANTKDLDAMFTEARTGYEPYADRPQRNKSVLSNAASSIYSSLSLRSKKSRQPSYKRGNAHDGQWDEYGSWQQLQEDNATMPTGAPIYRPADPNQYAAGGAQDRPLLSAVDETPRKNRYGTPAEPDSPTRGSTPNHYRGQSAPTQSAQPRGFTLTDNPVSYLSPAGPQRTKSAVSARSAMTLDSPSIYSTTTCEPMSAASPASQYPETLQPGRSPAIGRIVSPPLPTSTTGNRKIYRQPTKGAPSYSLSGVAGVLYGEGGNEGGDSSPSQSSYTAMPPRKPRKQSVLSKYRPRGVASPLSDEATAGETDTPNPHRAVSAVVRASRARGSSADGHDSPGLTDHMQYLTGNSGRNQLGASQASRDSIDDLLHNVLGPARSPA